MSAEAVRAHLSAAATPWQAPIEAFAELGSTNDYLKRRAQTAPAWSAVLAERQTAGRGRGRHGWESLAGNLHLSVLLRPPRPDPWSDVLTLGVGVVVAEALEGLAPSLQVELKWPNDLVCGGHKLGGILCEGVGRGGPGIEAVIVGIGVNVTHAPQRAEQATSLIGEGASVSVGAVAGAILSGLRLWYDARPPDVSGLLARWRARSVAWWGSEIEVRCPAGLMRGVVRDVDERGALLVDTRDGERRVISGEARQVRRVKAPGEGV